jgi:riboflavin synthase
MFTGIATNCGTVKNIKEKSSNEYTIESDIDLSKVKIGSSIMCSGICLTVINKKNKSFFVNVSEETLNVTNAKNWKIGTKLNLEKSLKVGDELGGHIVTGHIDDTSRLLRKRLLKKSSELIFELPYSLQKYVCKKGSIAIDGISLTINNVEKKSFSVSIIPHTSAITTLGNIKKDDIVNIEIDILARYIENNIRKTN